MTIATKEKHRQRERQTLKENRIARNKLQNNKFGHRRISGNDKTTEDKAINTKVVGGFRPGTIKKNVGLLEKLGLVKSEKEKNNANETKSNS